MDSQHKSHPEIITSTELTACINTLLDVDDVMRPTLTNKQRDAITTVITLLQDMRRDLPPATLQAVAVPADSVRFVVGELMGYAVVEDTQPNPLTGVLYSSVASAQAECDSLNAYNASLSQPALLDFTEQASQPAADALNAGGA